jgi:hypothetical protein
MIDIPKLISRLFEIFNPQKEMDALTALIIKADISKKAREELLGKTTVAKINYGYVNQGILLLAMLVGVVLLALRFR